MKQTVKTIWEKVKYPLLVVGVFLALGYAGEQDRRDAVRCHMQNTGAYYRLSEEHPALSDGELIDLYEQQQKEQKK